MKGLGWFKYDFISSTPLYIILNKIYIFYKNKL